MNENKHSPAIEVLTAIAPVEENGVFHSPGLSHAVRKEYGTYQPDLWENFLNHDPESLDEEFSGKNLASYYLLRTALDLQETPRDRALWVERFNQSAEELYGKPDKSVALSLIVEQAQEWENLETPTPASLLYQQIISHNPEVKSATAEEGELVLLREALLDEIPEIPRIIERLGVGPYDSTTVRDAFNEIIAELAKKDPDWNQWKITNHDTKTMLSVISSKKQIVVPDKRPPVNSKIELMGLAFHEIGVHAMRGVNGWKKNELLARGLPDNYEFEEGLGVAFEYIVTGNVPYKSKERYIDIALASGVIDGIRLTREQLIELGISRKQTHAIAQGDNPGASEEYRTVITNAVNRIFRGGDAVPVLEENTIRNQAVFTKDIAYYRGFLQAAKFLNEQRRAGKDLREVFGFILSGKFDPTNTRHIEYVQKFGIIPV